MKRTIAYALSIGLTLSAPLSAAAQNRGGGGGGARSAPAARPAARPAQRPPANNARPPGNGFNLNTDYNAGRPPGTRPPNGGNAGGTRPAPPNGGGGNWNGNGGGTRPPNGGGNWNGNYRPPGPHNPGYYGGRPIIVNPVYPPGPAWGWNRGVAWYPAPYYWGGGFWGALAIGATSAAIGAAVYGSIVIDNQTYTSYQVEPASPGATLLKNYQLRQTQCGPPDLVVIYGPDNSIICAFPSQYVAPGYYNLDPSQLSIVPAS
jgi:hypothetical protein